VTGVHRPGTAIQDIYKKKKSEGEEKRSRKYPNTGNLLCIKGVKIQMAREGWPGDAP